LSIVLLGYVAPLEGLPCVFGFLSRDAGAATTMGLFSAGWVALAVNFLMFGADAKTITLGIFLVMDSLAVFALTAASMGGKPLLGVILLLSAARFLLAAIVQFGAGVAVSIASGALGLLT
jgi:succinate-acetate transporter protein